MTSARRLFLRSLFVLLALPVTTHAASITIRIVAQGYASTLYDVYADLEPGARLGAVNLVGAGFTSLTTNYAGTTGIDPLLSGLVPNVFGDDRSAFSITNSAQGVAIGGPGPGTVLLATLTSPYGYAGHDNYPCCAIPVGVFDDPAYYGGAVYDDYLRLVPDAVVVQVQNGGYVFPEEWVHPTHPLPEPSLSALTAIAGAALLALLAARQLSRRRLRE